MLHLASVRQSILHSVFKTLDYCIVFLYNAYMKLNSKEILKALQRTGELLNWNTKIEILLIGGAAGAITGLLSENRVTQDCDVMHYAPNEARQVVLDAAAAVAKELGLADDWLNSKAMQMDILPHGWHNRKVHIGTFGLLDIYAVGRIDMLCMKFFANRSQDREDIFEMKPSKNELEIVRTYLNMLIVPSRNANLDQVASAFKLVDAMEEILNES